MPVTLERGKAEKTEQKPRAKGKKSYIILAAIPTFFTLAFHIICALGGAQFISEKISMPIARLLGGISAAFPFSVMELIYCLAVFGGVYFLVRTVWLICRSNKRVKTLLRRIFILALAVFYIYTAFLWLWGANYRMPSLAERNGFSADGISTRDLFYVTAAMANGANEFSKLVPRDENGKYIDERELYWDGSVTLYDDFGEEFSYPKQKAYPVKEMFFGEFMSRLGFTGIYFPFTAESSVNTAPPPMLTPFVIAHESAHQQGLAQEQEANFAGVVTCLSSDNPIYNYSGYLAALNYLSSALYSSDADLWYKIAAGLNEEARHDIAQNSEYWASLRSKVTEAAETVYDGYLKANRQPEGIKSYGACVDLLVQYYIDKIEFAE